MAKEIVSKNCKPQSFSFIDNNVRSHSQQLNKINKNLDNSFNPVIATKQEISLC
ncbi:MAG: hypothetical protein ACPKPY_03285 [Nitrososphaeraceae archaeon]